MAVLQQHVDDIHAVARAAISALHGPAAPPAAVVAVPGELGVLPGVPGRPGRDAGIDALTGPAHGRRRQFAPVVAFGVTIADVMLHDRRGDPDPVIAAWLAETEAGRTSTAGPSNILAHWGRASPVLQAALVKPLASRLDTFYQLRYRALAGPARVPDLAQADEHARALPPLLWPGWALRLMPPEGFDFLRYRFAVGLMLAVASAGAADYRTAQELPGLQPVHGNRFATFIARLREHGVLEPVTAAICQLARRLDEHGAPVDYARRRRLRRLSQAQLDVAGWRRQRYFLTHPDTWAHRRHLDRADLPAAPVQEHFARFRLIELLTGTHPYYLPEPLQLPERRGQDYAEFAFTLPEPMARFPHHRARFLLRHAGIDEPVTWEPPFDRVTGITWPGPHPDSINPCDLHPLIQSSLPVRVIAARLSTTAEHVRLAAARHPAPQPPADRAAQAAPAEPEAPGTGELRAFTAQGFGPRKIARITGCSERTIRQLLTGAGLRQAPRHPDGDIEPHWLREQYQVRQRSLKDIAAETGVPVATLAAAARNAGIPVRHGINGRAHSLAGVGAPGAFPPAVWNAFTRPHAEQRIRRLLALPGQPSLHHAARHLSVKHATLASQIRQLEDVTGITLLRTSPDGTITLTADGERFARAVRPVLESLAQSRSKNASHAP
jgi:regulatory helix-turn-helix LysR family protein